MNQATDAKIPFNRPHIAGRELFYIAQAVMAGHLSGDGSFTARCQQWLERTYNARRAFLTTSGTAALEMAALLCDIQPGDEFIVPGFTFVSTVNAFVLRGARPVFMDIKPDTLCIDESQVERAITPRTRVIVPVHYAGVAAEMDEIMLLAERYNLLVVEDAAMGMHASYKGRWLGTMGHFGCFSFHETKNFISGEGGAILINDERFLKRAEIVREKGTNRTEFFRGDAEFYTWVDVGSSYLPSEITAAFLYAQLEASDVICRRRQEIIDVYTNGLESLAQQGRFRLPICPPSCRNNSHMFYLLLSTAGERQRLLAFLKERQIGAVFHYIPLHTSPMGRLYGGKEGDLPITEDLSRRLVRLPCYFDLTKTKQERVIGAVEEFFVGL